MSQKPQISAGQLNSQVIESNWDYTYNISNNVKKSGNEFDDGTMQVFSWYSNLDTSRDFPAWRHNLEKDDHIYTLVVPDEIIWKI